MRRRTLLASVLAAAGAAGLAACGADDTSGASGASGGAASDGGASGGGVLDTVTVKGAFGAEPTVTFDAPLSFSAPEAKIITPGDGEAIAEGDALGMHTAYIDATSGEVLQSSWQGAPAEFLAVSVDSNGQEAVDFLTTATVGSRIAMLGQVTDSQGKEYQVVQVSDIVSKALPRATGTPQPIPADQPQFTLAENGAPQLSGTPTTPAPSTTVATVTIQGEGDQTAEGDTLAMHYTGWKLSDGSQFDSSWDRGEPFSFTLGQNQVIQGWDVPLTGKTVGSQVLLVIPPAEAYGEAGQSQSELAGETLIFVADILGAVKAPAA